MHLPVGKTTAFDCEMIRKPSDLADGPVIVKMKSQRDNCLPQTLRVALVNGKIHMNVTNSGQGELHMYKDQNIWVVDLRSAGYFHITRDSIQRCLHETFIFLNEEESQHYLSIIYTSNYITLQMNTRIDMGKTNIDETEKKPIQSKYSKDDTEKDPYPWLDKNSPRRHMADKEILESTIKPFLKLYYRKAKTSSV